MKVKLGNYVNPSVETEADYVDVVVGGRAYRISQARNGNPDGISVSNPIMGALRITPVASNVIEVNT